MTRPLKPGEVLGAKKAGIPEQVFTVFNEHIAREWNGYEALVKQEPVVVDIAKALGIDRSEVFARNLLEVDDLYRQEGWHVEYDKPGFNESYAAFWRFRKR